ncbi:MAG: ATP-binding protein [Coleofasciculus sp. D1-CHI-01]|uniref:ATP-binding protein n=1 Tax=Coleofasciculus sp. D1-CHI-01 TaxID=3068482 RepID=UPI00330107D9
MSVAKDTTTINWYVVNSRRDLMNAIAQVRQALMGRIEQRQGKETEPIAIALPEEEEDAPPSALTQLCQIFRLSGFERDVLLLCAGMELDDQWGALCAEAQGEAQQTYPTFGLAWALSAEPNLAALRPDAPLRGWRLIEVGEGMSRLKCPLRIDERIFDYLWGDDYIDSRLRGIVQPLSVEAEDYAVLPPSHQQIVAQIAATWVESSRTVLPVIGLSGVDGLSKSAIAAAVCRQLNLNLHRLSVAALTPQVGSLSLVKQLCEREWFLSHAVLFLEGDEMEEGMTAGLSEFIDTINLPLIVSSPERGRQRMRSRITWEVQPPTAEEQKAIWQGALGGRSLHLEAEIEAIVSQFQLSVRDIYTVCIQAQRSLEEEIAKKAAAQATPAPEPVEETKPKRKRRTTRNTETKTPPPKPVTLDVAKSPLWEICRKQARPQLEDLAVRIETRAEWEDLILPEREKGMLREMVVQVQQRGRVYETWGFAQKNQRGLGINALFSGMSGTGKTLAAEVLGNTLRLDVYRIDLSAVVSKYIGETEKNLRRIFDGAEGCGAILLFDEADALFGKRSEVKDSHDRHANIEVSYLLQRMETYRGLAILTTNIQTGLDQAFIRRIRFIVKFPYPGAKEREEIWRRVFPEATPTEGLDFKKLGKLHMAGGNIKTIAMNAAFLAAGAGEAVQMKHIKQAAIQECLKLERPMGQGELQGW